MAFWDTIKKIGTVVAPVATGIASGISGDKGLMGGMGEGFFGDTGKNKYNVPEYQRAPLSPIIGERFQGGENTEYLRDRLKGEFTRNQFQRTPQAEFQGQTVGVRRVNTGQYGGATIDQSGFGQRMNEYSRNAQQAGEMRQRQMSDLGLTRGAAMGLAPSVAEQQLQQGLEARIAAQNAAAASARGGIGAQQAAQRQAAFQASQAMAETNQQAAALRAGEMAQARQDLLAGGQAIRAGDISQQGLGLEAAQTELQPALQQAALQQQAGLQNQALQAGADVQRMGLMTQAGMQTQALQNQIALANLQARLQQSGQQNQFSLGIMGQLGNIERMQTGGAMAYEQLRAQQELADAQMRQQAYFQTHGLNLGVAQQNAAAEMQNLGLGLGFMSPMMSTAAAGGGGGGGEKTGMQKAGSMMAFL